jgi:thymidylate synthase
MKYKEILQNIITNGKPKQPVRFDSNNNPVPVENGTIGTFCEIFRHDMSEGFPLTTLRRMPFKSMSVELEGFIKGITDKKWYQDRGCKFWNEWANPESLKEIYEKSFIDIEMGFSGSESDQNRKRIIIKQAQKSSKDLGPIYGYQWRNFGQNYTFDNWGHPNCFSETEDLLAYPDLDMMDGLVKGFDQLQSIVDKLKTNPYDRRMVCSAWNPNQSHMMALMPCHYSFTVVVYEDKLNLCWKQRSVDSILGLPNNIASYAILLLLLCEESGLKPGELVGVLEDCHIYENHMSATKELLKREEKELPQVKIKRKEDGSFSIFDWTYEDVELIDYNPHPKLDMGSVTV